jgi:hypothetical protein
VSRNNKRDLNNIYNLYSTQSFILWGIWVRFIHRCEYIFHAYSPLFSIYFYYHHIVSTDLKHFVWKDTETMIFIL